jgi:hypothetical protein
VTEFVLHRHAGIRVDKSPGKMFEQVARKLSISRFNMTMVEDFAHLILLQIYPIHERENGTVCQLAADCSYASTLFKCNVGDTNDCFGQKHHLFLCDICGLPTRSNEGCDVCDQSPCTINMEMMRRLDPEINAEEEWRKYVDAVKQEQKYATMYPDLEYNADTWREDLTAHILVRRVKYWNGSKAEELKEKKVTPVTSIVETKANSVGQALGQSSQAGRSSRKRMPAAAVDFKETTDRGRKAKGERKME